MGQPRHARLIPFLQTSKFTAHSTVESVYKDHLNLQVKIFAGELVYKFFGNFGSGSTV